MSLKVITWVWDHSESQNAARLVLLAIADCASGDGTQAWPSGAELRRKAKLSARAVQNATQELIELGELKVEWNAGPGGVNRYTVLMKTPAESAPPQNLRPRKDCAPADSAGGETQPEADTTTQDPPQNLRPAESAPPQNLRTEPSLFISSNKQTSGRKRNAPPPEHPLFAEFWSTYPRREGKGKAREAFTKAVDGGATPKAIVSAAAHLATHHLIRRTETKYIPMPATWLNQERWEDDLGSAFANQDRPSTVPPHCGHCDPQGRWIETADGRLAPCPDCHPDAVRNRS